MGIILTDEELKKLQRIELEMLIEIDRICRKYNIEYSLDGGSLIGAVRDKGFVPWDDDADVAMTREQYKKFRKACKKELDRKRFFLQDFGTDPYYRWGYSKLRRNGTLLVGEGQEHMKANEGVFLDIFIYDNVPDNYFLRRIHCFLCFCIRKVQYSEIGKLHAKSRFLRAWYSLLNKIPVRHTFIWIEMLQKRLNRKKTELARHMTFSYDYAVHATYGFPRKVFDDYIDVEFEGRKFRAFKDYDTYLYALYGDYMTPQPPEERKPYPVSKMKLIDVDV